MIDNNQLSICLYTSTKGHFDRHDIYQKTIDGLFCQLPSATINVSVKVDSSSQQYLESMERYFADQSCNYFVSYGEWKHGDEGKGSHQKEYLNDMCKMVNYIKTPYYLHMEDDWKIKAYGDAYLSNCLELGMELLRNNPHVMQVRIPRYCNESDRINNLKKKHDIDGKSERLNEVFFGGDDWSNHPHIGRTRDLRAALLFMQYGNLPPHSEFGLGLAMKALSAEKDKLPFAFFDPKLIRCGHMGTPSIETEDDLNKDLFIEIV